MARLNQFRQILGNTGNLLLIKQSLVKRSFPQFSIFHGDCGTGKSSAAEISALFLLCEDPNYSETEPCLKCPSCQANLKGLGTTGQSSNLIKKNLAFLSKDKKIGEVLSSLFKLQHTDRTVYILEEPHILSDAEQCIFNEELQRLSSNVYVILCTSRFNKIAKDLKSRAIKFQFSKLKPNEAKFLLKTQCTKNKFSLDKEVEDKILTYCNYIPRDIINTIDFLASSNPSAEQIWEFLSYISEDQIIDLLQSENLIDFSKKADVLLDTFGVDKVLKSVLDFLYVFSLKEFSGKPIKLGELNSKTCFRFNKTASSLNREESALKLALLELHVYMYPKTISQELQEIKSTVALNKSIKEDTKMEYFEKSSFLKRI